VPAQTASAYDRSNYGNGYHAQFTVKRRRVWPKVLGTILAVLVVVLGVAIGAALWYGSQLDAALAPDKEMSRKLDQLLVPANMNEPFYVLILGSDSREGSYSTQSFEQGDNQRSDVIILARVDAKNKLVTLVSVPRDTPWQLEDGTLVKINEMYNMEGAAGSVKAVSELYSPVSGKVVEINEELQSAPELINKDAAAAWMIKVEPSEAPTGLLSEEEYQKLIKE